MPALVPASFSLLVAGRDPEPSVSGDEWLTRLPRLAANPGRWTMLLERLDSARDLYDIPIDEPAR